MEHSKYKDYMSMGFTHRNASILAAADGLTTAEAVKYITHGPEMVTFIGNCRYVWQKDAEGLRKKAEAFKAKLDKEGA